jgi:hypothetical protein
MPDAVGQDQEIPRGVEKLSRAEEDAREVVRDALPEPVVP